MAALPYMQLYVADYLADTAHLTAAQHGAYLLLIFNYWQRGNPLNNSNERLANVARMTVEEWEIAKPVLSEFFEIDGDDWRHERIERDLLAVTSKSIKARAAGKASAASKANERSTGVEQTLNHTDTDTDKEKSKQSRGATASRLPADWKPDEAGLAFCKAERPDLQADSVADRFRDYWTAQPGAKGRKTDWPATWRNWVRNENAPKVVAQKQTADSPKPGDKKVINGAELTYYAGLGFAL